MKTFERGVQSYAVATVKLAFPDRNVCCGLCPMLETYARKQCRRTGEYIVDDRLVGLWCPLEILEEEKTNVTESIQ